MDRRTSQQIRDAGFFDFMRRKPVPIKVRGGILPSIVQPDNLNGPLTKTLNRVAQKHSSDLEITDWEVTNNGDTLVVTFRVTVPQPEMIYADGDLEFIDLSPNFNREIQPLIRELSVALGTKVSANVMSPDKITLVHYLYTMTLNLPPGTARQPDYAGKVYAPATYTASQRIAAGEARLRSKLIRLAHENPDIRPHILPLLRNR